MSDRRHPMYPPNTYPQSQWSGASEPSQMYPPPAGHYSSSTYSSSSSSERSHNQGNVTHHSSPPYPNAEAQGGDGAGSYTNAYYSSASQYSSIGSPVSPNQQPSLYPLGSPTVTSSRQHHSHSHSHSHPQSTSPAQSHPAPHSRSRSHSQPHPYLPQASGHSAVLTHQLPVSQYHLSQTISIPAQYPASPSRPFSCDMCALSFNRAHDLSRHRQTHTGEKPFLCNGGCGKSFTRFAAHL
jgi:hypothetical protein